MVGGAGMIDDAMRAMIGAAELAKLLTRARQNLSEKPEIGRAHV